MQSAVSSLTETECQCHGSGLCQAMVSTSLTFAESSGTCSAFPEATCRWECLAVGAESLVNDGQLSGSQASALQRRASRGATARVWLIGVVANAKWSFGGPGKAQADEAPLEMVMADAPCSWAIAARPRVRVRQVENKEMCPVEKERCGGVEVDGKHVHVCTIVVVLVDEDVACLLIQTKKRCEGTGTTMVKMM